MSVLEDVRDHLKATIEGHDAAIASEQAAKTQAGLKLDAVEAELAKPVLTVSEQLKALVAQLA